MSLKWKSGCVYVLGGPGSIGAELGQVRRLGKARNALRVSRSGKVGRMESRGMSWDTRKRGL